MVISSLCLWKREIESRARLVFPGFGFSVCSQSKCVVVCLRGSFDCAQRKQRLSELYLLIHCSLLYRLCVFCFRIFEVLVCYIWYVPKWMNLHLNWNNSCVCWHPWLLLHSLERLRLHWGDRWYESWKEGSDEDEDEEGSKLSFVLLLPQTCTSKIPSGDTQAAKLSKIPLATRKVIG